jgi:hypothetical protein
MYEFGWSFETRVAGGGIDLEINSYGSCHRASNVEMVGDFGIFQAVCEMPGFA